MDLRLATCYKGVNRLMTRDLRMVTDHGRRRSEGLWVLLYFVAVFHPFQLISVSVLALI
jgi:hypothetical protein